MSKYDQEYYVVDELYNEETLYLKPLKKTADRDYEYKKLELDGEPLYFENSYKAEDLKRNHKRPLMKAHMDGNFLVVNEEIGNAIRSFDIEHFQLYPAVIIDDEGNHHEHYWFFNIHKDSDYLDIRNCEIDNYDEDDKRHSFETYSLNEALLDGVTEEQRLIFSPAHTDIGHTIIHQKVVDTIVRLGGDNLQFYSLSEWEDGI